MKSLSLFLVCFLILACSGKPGSNSTDQKADPTKARGGVDVGNKMKECNIPGTNLYVTHPESWPCTEVKRSAATETSTSSKLILSNSFSSKIEASRTNLNLVSPTPFTLEKYLEYKYKDLNRDYKYIEINGLKGVRAEVLNSAQQKKSDIYLVTELYEIVHISTDLNYSADGFETGEKIVSTVRLKYKGEAITDSAPKKITLSGFEGYLTLNESIFDPIKTEDMGVHVVYSPSPDESKRMDFWVPEKNKKNLDPNPYLHLYDNSGRAGGQFIKLGNATNMSFDSVKVENDYIVGTDLNITIEDLYKTLSTENSQEDKSRIIPVAGDIYLIRTKNWPDEDLFSKIQIDTLNSDKKLSFTIQKLIAVPPQVLRHQIELMNKNNIENEATLREGEVILYNSSIWKNTVYNKFNFKYSNTGNKFITKDTWDFAFSNCPNNSPTLAPASDLGAMIDFGDKDLHSLSKADFPAFKWNPEDHCKTNILTNTTYGFINTRGGKERGTTYGAVKVLQIGNENSWIHLKFNRIHVGPVEHFQNWVSDPDFSYDIESFEHKADYDYKNEPLELMLLKFTREQNITISLNDTDDELCYYDTECGVLNLGKSTDFEKIQLQDLVTKKGHYVRKSDISQGDVIAVWREDRSDKYLAVIKIDEITQNKTIKFRQRTLEKMYAQYEVE